MRQQFLIDIGQASPNGETSETLLPTPTTKQNQGAPSMEKQGPGCQMWGELMRLPTPTLNADRNTQFNQGGYPLRARLPASLEDFRVSQCRWQDRETGRVMTVGCGTLFATLSESSNPDTYWSKTSQDSGRQRMLLDDGEDCWEEYSETFPEWGTMRNGELWRHPTSALPTCENVSLSLPTPNTLDYLPSTNLKERKKRGESKNLKDEITKLPTPRARMAKYTVKQRMGGHRGNLEEIVAELLPTPRSTDGTKGSPNQAGSKGDLMLPSAVQKLATPTSRDWRSGKVSEATHAKNSRPLSEQTGGQLNPQFVEGMMGFPPGWTYVEEWKD